MIDKYFGTFAKILIMKKIFSLILFLTITAMSIAQTIYMKQDFEGATFPPAGWTVIDNDDDGYDWKPGAYPGQPAHDGTGSTYSESYDLALSTPLTPDNWLITEQIDLITAGGVELKWWIYAQEQLFAEEKYSVKISTTGNAIADFTTQLFDETVGATNDVYVVRTLDISSYAGNLVYIAFVHAMVTDMFYLNLDDISVMGTVGVNEESVDNSLRVYPNPAKDVLNVQLSREIKQIRMFNTLGQEVINQIVGENNATINTSNYSGVFYLNIETETGTITKKVSIIE